MAPKAAKRKAEEAVAEPSTKEAKTEDTEKDAPADSRAALKSPIGFNIVDSTINVVPAMDGKVLMALTEGGMQYLIAGARGSVGMKAGRYMFEVKMIESLNPAESSQGASGRVPQPRQIVKIGFSTENSPLVLGDSVEHIFFDSEGWFTAERMKKRSSQLFSRDQVIAVLLNLDQKSPNANTVSMFREGQRICEPQPLPDSLKGKTLFPHVSYRNVTLQVNMGPTPFKELPFKCRMLQSAASADVVDSSSKVPKSYEVVLPVCLPDQGTFDWLDGFLEKNPSYVELSDRKIQDWAQSSGLAKPRATGGSSNDKPSFAYSLAGMDDMSIQKVTKSITPTMPRNYVVMEVKSNLIAEERAEVLKRFNDPRFKKVAQVVIGEPKEEFKKKVHARLLEEKQAKSDMEWRAKKSEKDKIKQVKKRQKEIARQQKEAAAKRQKMAEEFKKKQEAELAKKKAEEEAKKKAEAGEAKEGEEAKKEEEEKEEEKAEVKEEEKVKVEDTKEEEEEEEEEEADDMGDEPPKVELTDEDKKVCFRPKIGDGDINPALMNRIFPQFSIPEKAEGFDEIRFEWLSEAKSKDHLREFVLNLKRTSRIEDLQPSQSFKERQTAWQKQYLEWQAKQSKFKAKPVPAPKKEPEGEKKEEDKKEGEEKKGAFDIFSVEDVCDIGEGEPLFANFASEDWALLQLRSEMHLLQDAYKKDVNDGDRETIPEQHLAFYYQRYFGKQLNTRMFACNTNAEFLELIKDTVVIAGEPPVLTSKLPEDVDNADIFLKFTEDCRRDRKRRSDAGDETAKLKYTPQVQQAVAAPKASGQQAPKWGNKQGGNRGWGGKGGGKW